MCTSNESHHHEHSHEHHDHPGFFDQRESLPFNRNFSKRAFTVGIGGPVGSGKTALIKALCEKMRNTMSLAVVTNDIFTQEDAEFLIRNHALPKERITGVQTGGCPHAAIREDISLNMYALDELGQRFHGNIDMFFVESGGDNLAADYSRELADFTIYVIDVSGGDKIPRKGGPGITQSDLLIINKTDIAQYVGSDLSIMERDSKKMRDYGPFLFIQAVHNIGVDNVMNIIIKARNRTLSGVGLHYQS